MVILEYMDSHYIECNLHILTRTHMMTLLDFGGSYGTYGGYGGYGGYGYRPFGMVGGYGYGSGYGGSYGGAFGEEDSHLIRQAEVIIGLLVYNYVPP